MGSVLSTLSPMTILKKLGVNGKVDKNHL